MNSRPLGYCVSQVDSPNTGSREQNLLSLSYGNIIRKDIAGSDGLLPETFETYNVVEPGDTVLRLTDLQNDQRSLRVGFVQERGIITSAYVTLRPKHDVDPQFFSYVLKSMDFRKDFYALGAGVRQSLKFDELKRVQIHLPAFEKQRAIADYLDTETARIDALIEKKQRMIELLERRSAATLDDRLSGLFRPDVPLVPLRHVLREHDERAVGTETVLSVYRDYGVIVKASREDNFNKTPDDLANYKTVRRGDVVVNKMKAWQGSLGVSSHDGIVSGDYLVCETTSAAVMHDYLHHLLRSPLLIGQYGVRSTGIRPSQWRLYWDDFASVRIPVPSASEQAELAGALEREYQLTRRLLDVVDGSIGLLREHRQALIIAAVTGELAVPGVAA